MSDYRPPMQHQGPASNCVLHGQQLGWLSCTSYGAAMAADQATRGKVKVSGCEVRDRTGDYIGGLNLPQMHAVMQELGIQTELRSGANVCTPAYAARRCQADQAFILQGNTTPLLTTQFRSTNGPVNHLVMVSAVKGGDSDNPDAALVYDPAADGRRAGISSGPVWWPWSLVKQFAAALRPWGDDDPRTLGPGKFYALIYPPTPAPPVTRKYTVHVRQRATVRVYEMSGECIRSWTDHVWQNPNSQAPCFGPRHFRTCNNKSGAITVLVKDGAYQGKRIRIGRGVTVTENT